MRSQKSISRGVWGKAVFWSSLLWSYLDFCARWLCTFWKSIWIACQNSIFWLIWDIEGFQNLTFFGLEWAHFFLKCLGRFREIIGPWWDLSEESVVVVWNFGLKMFAWNWLFLDRPHILSNNQWSINFHSEDFAPDPSSTHDSFLRTFDKKVFAIFGWWTQILHRHIRTIFGSKNAFFETIWKKGTIPLPWIDLPLLDLFWSSLDPKQVSIAV